MTATSNIRLAAISLALLCACGGLQRDNPLDPSVSQPEDGEAPTLSLVVSLPRALASIVDRIIATLQGPDMTTIVKELDHSPLGPATLTIGAISPGSGRTLIIEGVDFEGQLILRGEQRNIEIVVGDTTRVTIDLELVSSGAEGSGKAGGDSGNP